MSLVRCATHHAEQIATSRLWPKKLVPTKSGTRTSPVANASAQTEHV